MQAFMVLVTLLVILLLICVIAMYVLYYSLYRGFVSIKRTVEEVTPAQNDVISAVNGELDAFLGILQTIEEQSLDCYSTCMKYVKDAEENKNEAMKTIKATRQIQKTLKNVSYLENASQTDSDINTFATEERTLHNEETESGQEEKENA